MKKGFGLQASGFRLGSLSFRLCLLAFSSGLPFSAVILTAVRRQPNKWKDPSPIRGLGEFSTTSATLLGQGDNRDATPKLAVLPPPRSSCSARTAPLQPLQRQQTLAPRFSA